MKGASAVIALAVAFGIQPDARAQTYPSKPITIVVPFSAGGPTDTLARFLTEPLRANLGQPILVDNTTGAGGTIGTGKVVRSAPDGHMVSIGHWGTHVVNGAYYTNLTFSVISDFEPVAWIASNPQLIVSKNAVPATNLKELVAWIGSNPKSILMATGGVGGASHIAAIYFQNQIGAKFEYVAYRGGAPVWPALLGGQVDMFVTQVSSAITHVRAGKVRAYAVTAKNRQAAAPEIPTVDEAGLPGLHTSVWHGLWLPKGTPRSIVSRLNSAVVVALADANVQKRFADLGQDIPVREQQTPEALGAHHKTEVDKWWPMIKAAGIKAE